MIRCLFPVVLIALASPLMAQFEAPVRQHSAHVHGQAEGQLAVDGASVQLSLQIPAFNLLGFEHAPRGADKRRIVEATVDHLDALDWLLTPAGAACVGESVELDAIGLGANSAESRHDHDGAHDHDDDHAHGHDDHAAFELSIQLRCAEPDKLTWLELSLFEDYPANESIRLDLLTATRVDRLTLDVDRPRVELQP